MWDFRQANLSHRHKIYKILLGFLFLVLVVLQFLLVVVGVSFHDRRISSAFVWSSLLNSVSFFFLFVCTIKNASRKTALLKKRQKRNEDGEGESNRGKEKNHQKKKKSIHTINNCVETLHCFLFVLFCLVWSGRIFPSLCFSPDLPHSLSLSRWQWPLTFSRSSFLARQVLLGFSSHSLSLLLSFSYCFVDKKKKPSADLKIW